MTTTKKLIIAVVALSLALLGVVGGTLAYLHTSTKTVTNTFTYGDINIELKESDNLDLKLVPGRPITKDPYVIVEKGSEACYLFVKIQHPTELADRISYDIAEGWTKLEGKNDVYYRIVSADAEKYQTFYILKDNKVQVSKDLTKDEMKNLNAGDVTLAFTAYAVQSYGVTDAAAAWAIVNP